MAHKKWYLVQVKQNSYRVAERNLAYQGISCFQPLSKLTERRGVLFKNVSRPFFPGYMFVTFNPSDTPWRKINNTFGVARLLCRGGVPAMAPVGLVEALQESVDSDGHVILSDDLKAGDRIQIREGPFVGFFAQIKGLKPDLRVSLLVELVGQYADVVTDISKVYKDD